MGQLNNIIKFLADKVVQTKYQKYFEDLHNDTEYQKALKEIKKAPERIEKAGIAAVKAQEEYKKTYDAYVKKYGKENAVRIQINIAIITYCLVSIIAKDLKINRSIYEILQILSASLLDKTPVNELLMKSDYNNVNEHITNQLVFNLF
jgi:hypothetical protein